MAAQDPAPVREAQREPLRARLARAWGSRWFWPLWVLAGCLVLAASQALWLWHSWPVRELLDSEPAAGGPSI